MASYGYAHLTFNPNLVLLAPFYWPRRAAVPKLSAPKSDARVLWRLDARGAEELNDYVEQVEDIGEQLDERRKWMSDIMHDFATNLAQKQGEQINRLTLVSLIFLPVTALTGFFGMNFDWMVRSLSGGEAFFGLGVLLPALCVGLTFAWLVRRKLVRFRLWPETIQEADPQMRRDEVSGGAPSNAPTATAHSGIGILPKSQESSANNPSVPG